MKRCKAAVLLLAAVLLCFSAGCGAKASLVGTWEVTTEASLLGLGTEQDGQTVTGTVRFAFRDDGSGQMDAEFDTKYPSNSRTFQYSTQDDQLTVKYDGGGSELYTFTLEGDTLTLDGRVHLELSKKS